MATGASAAVRRSLSYYYTGRSGGDVIGGESGSLGEEAPDALTVLTRPREAGAHRAQPKPAASCAGHGAQLDGRIDAGSNLQA